MMIERHYDDEALIALMESDRLRTDAHLPSCAPCSEKLESFQMIADALRERDTWDTRDTRSEPVPATIATLRAFADRMTSEDAQAEIILESLLAGPREAWMPRLREHPEWRTAGVVRKLVERTSTVVMSMPPDALEMTALSTEIADHLEPARLAPSDGVTRLRGSAWRDRAYVLFYVGRYDDAMSAADRADVILRGCTVDEYDRARVGIVRSLVFRAKEDMAASMSEARRSSETFTRFGDITRFAAARLAEVAMLMASADYESALELLWRLDAQMRHTADANTHARVLGNLGYCYAKLGKINEALRYNDAAAMLFDEIGVRTEAVRLRWTTATVLASAGRIDEAYSRLDHLKEAFDDLVMTSEAALVRLDIADILLSRGQYSSVEAICREAMRSFETSGVTYTPRALTALAYIQETARARSATPALVRHVREYIRRLPQDGELLFAPPPLDDFS